MCSVMDKCTNKLSGVNMCLGLVIPCEDATGVCSPRGTTHPSSPHIHTSSAAYPKPHSLSLKEHKAP